ncbi:unnamed protein product [Urochloa humidicola]
MWARTWASPAGFYGGILRRESPGGALPVLLAEVVSAVGCSGHLTATVQDWEEMLDLHKYRGVEGKNE